VFHSRRQSFFASFDTLDDSVDTLVNSRNTPVDLRGQPVFDALPLSSEPLFVVVCQVHRPCSLMSLDVAV
jgi:hypothetical protein